MKLNNLKRYRKYVGVTMQELDDNVFFRERTTKELENGREVTKEELTKSDLNFLSYIYQSIPEHLRPCLGMFKEAYTDSYKNYFGHNYKDLIPVMQFSNYKMLILINHDNVHEKKNTYGYFSNFGWFPEKKIVRFRVKENFKLSDYDRVQKRLLSLKEVPKEIIEEKEIRIGG